MVTMPKAEQYELNPKLVEKIESLLPGQALVIECSSREQARHLHKSISRFVVKETNNGTLPHDYSCTLNPRLKGYVITVKCHERPKLRLLEKSDEGWEIISEEVL